MTCVGGSRFSDFQTETISPLKMNEIDTAFPVIYKVTSEFE